MINVFYIPKIKRVSGITTWIREIAKKYYKYDITVVYDEADKKQLAFLKQYVRCQKLTEPIKCKKLFMTYHANTKLIEAEEAIEDNYKRYSKYTNFEKRLYKEYKKEIEELFNEIQDER